MGKTFFLTAMLMFLMSSIYAQHLKKDGTPDRRYKENKTNYNSTPGSTNTDVRYQNGYNKSNGTYVEPHYKTENNNTNTDNYSSKDNTNPYTSKEGSKAKDYSKKADNYGKGKTIYAGEKGGQYYYNDRGKKVYVPKR